MGLLARILGREKRPQNPTDPQTFTPTHAPAAGHGPPRIDLAEDVEVAGETYYDQAFSHVFTRAGRPNGGQVTRTAELHPEPHNQFDRHAVAVVIDGVRVGFVPADLSPRIQPAALQHRQTTGQPLTVPANVWARYDFGQWQARVTLLFVSSPSPEWSYVDHFPATGHDKLTYLGTTKAMEAAKGAARIDGYDNFEDALPDVTQYKVDGNEEKALELALRCIPAAERVAAVWRSAPTVWPTEEVAKVYRRSKDYAAEVAVLERLDRATPAGRERKRTTERLARARQLLDPDSAPAPTPVTAAAPKASAAAKQNGDTAALRAERIRLDGAQRREETLAAGGERAREQGLRLVDGRDYTEWAEVIRDLKRDGQLQDALTLALKCVDATEREAADPAIRARSAGYGDGVPTLPPGYTNEAAVIYRKLGDLDGEVAVLERYLAASAPQVDSRVMDRLVKARALKDRRSTA